MTKIRAICKLSVGQLSDHIVPILGQLREHTERLAFYITKLLVNLNKYKQSHSLNNLVRLSKESCDSILNCFTNIFSALLPFEIGCRFFLDQSKNCRISVYRSGNLLDIT